MVRYIFFFFLFFISSISLFFFYENKEQKEEVAFKKERGEKEFLSLKEKEEIKGRIQVIDGDTIHIHKKGEKEKIRIRFIGIDAPEIFYEKEKEDDCFAKEAKEKLASLLEKEESIFIEFDIKQEKEDVYGRLLGYLETKEIPDIGLLLLEEGFVKEYTFKNIPYTKQEEYKNAQKSAKENKRGLWAVCME
jgi:micrococcal nuclease